jgi:hypothetical protein
MFHGSIVTWLYPAKPSNSSSDQFLLMAKASLVGGACRCLLARSVSAGTYAAARFAAMRCIALARRSY